MTKRTGPYKPRRTGRDSHFLRTAVSEHFDHFCVLCGGHDGNDAGRKKLEANCYVGSGFCGTHTIEVYADHGTPTHPAVRCTECKTTNRIGLIGPCYEILPTVDFDASIDTTAVDGTTVASTTENVGMPVKNLLTPPPQSVKSLTREEVGSIIHKSRTVESGPWKSAIVATMSTPFGDVSGSTRAIKYVYDLMKTAEAVKNEKQEFVDAMRTLIEEHAKAPNPLLQDLIFKPSEE